jgi:heme exporter protein A
MPSSTLVDLEGVSVRRPGALLLRDVTLRIETGEVVTLLGANGSGKSTLLRVVATLLAPSGGAGTVLGATLGTEEVAAVRRFVGLVGHSTGLRRGLTLAENLELVAALGGGGDAAAALARVGLGGAADRRVEHCSNGMLRRADLARLMLTGPRLALLDEAHVGLDPSAVSLVDDLVAGVTARGGAVITVTHDPRRSTTGRAVVLDDGVLKRAER